MVKEGPDDLFADEDEDGLLGDCPEPEFDLVLEFLYHMQKRKHTLLLEVM